MIIKNKPSKDILYKLYNNDGLVLKDIAKIYKCSISTVSEWMKNYNISLRSYSEAQLKRYKDPLEREKTSEMTRKRYDDPLEREKTAEMTRKRWEDPTEREKMIESMVNGWKNPLVLKRAAEITRKRYENPLEHEKSRKFANKYWEDPLKHERASANMQGQNYDKGEWTGFVNNPRVHLILPSQCIHLNPWFEGCNQHHIMTGVIINIPADLHRSVWHQMPNSNKNDKNMVKINKLAFKYLLGKL